MNYRTLNHNNKLYIVQHNELTLFDRPSENVTTGRNYVLTTQNTVNSREISIPMPWRKISSLATVMDPKLNESPDLTSS